MTRSLAVVVGAALTLAAAGAAQAQITGDLNKDGKLSQAEFVGGAATLIMSALDADRDGKITRDEFKARRPAIKHLGAGTAFDPPPSLVPLDQNRDGSATRKEVETMLTKRFHSLDASGNGDGFLTTGETK